MRILGFGRKKDKKGAQDDGPESIRTPAPSVKSQNQPKKLMKKSPQNRKSSAPNTPVHGRQSFFDYTPPQASAQPEASSNMHDIKQPSRIPSERGDASLSSGDTYRFKSAPAAAKTSGTKKTKQYPKRASTSPDESKGIQDLPIQEGDKEPPFLQKHNRTESEQTLSVRQESARASDNEKNADARRKIPPTPLNLGSSRASSPASSTDTLRAGVTSESLGLGYPPVLYSEPEEHDEISSEPSTDRDIPVPVTSVPPPSTAPWNFSPLSRGPGTRASPSNVPDELTSPSASPEKQYLPHISRTASLASSFSSASNPMSPLVPSSPASRNNSLHTEAVDYKQIAQRYSSANVVDALDRAGSTSNVQSLLEPKGTGVPRAERHDSSIDSTLLVNGTPMLLSGHSVWAHLCIQLLPIFNNDGPACAIEDINALLEYHVNMTIEKASKGAQGDFHPNVLPAAQALHSNKLRPKHSQKENDFWPHASSLPEPDDVSVPMPVFYALASQVSRLYMTGSLTLSSAITATDALSYLAQLAHVWSNFWWIVLPDLDACLAPLRLVHSGQLYLSPRHYGLLAFLNNIVLPSLNDDHLATLHSIAESPSFDISSTSLAYLRHMVDILVRIPTNDERHSTLASFASALHELYDEPEKSGHDQESLMKSSFHSSIFTEDAIQSESHDEDDSDFSHIGSGSTISSQNSPITRSPSLNEVSESTPVSRIDRQAPRSASTSTPHPEFFVDNQRTPQVPRPDPFDEINIVNAVDASHNGS